MLAHPDPVDALVIGVSGGSWARVVGAYSSVGRIDAVEINPGYRRMIDFYEDVRPLLKDERFTLNVDDGRRWLRRNPGNEYDVIAINSTFHWRSGATNLLSREFLSEVRRHVKPGGIVLLNATGSLDVVKTATEVFEYAFGYGNSVLMSDTDFRSVLRNSDERIFDAIDDPQVGLRCGVEMDHEIARRVARRKLDSLEYLESVAGRRGEVVTDFNMITEYRHADYR